MALATKTLLLGSIAPKKAGGGILGSGISTGNTTIDNILGGAAQAGINEAMGTPKGEDIQVALGNQVAKTWVEKNWPYLAGGVLVLYMFLKRAAKH